MHIKVFQSTFPQGERLHLDFVLFRLIKFQSTFPQGERLSCIMPFLL